MANQRERVISVEDAARMVFGTPHPTEQQVGRIRLKIAKGVIRRSSKGSWTTTPEAVADYLAAKAVHGAKSRGAESVRYASPKTDEFTRGYGKLLRDYFLAVALRRRVSGRSRTFDRAVLAGQVFTLCLGLLLLIGAYRHWVGVVVPEHAIVESYLDGEHGDYQIVEWFPAEKGSEGETRQRVRYRYFSKLRKSIQTDRVFIIRNGRVVGVDHESD